MSIILGAIGGAGEGLENVGAQMQRQQGAADIENLRAQLEAEKEDRINAYKDQGITRAQGLIQTAAAQQVPQEAAPVTNLTGAVSTASGPNNDGFIGDPAAALKNLQAMPDSAFDTPTGKADAIAQLQNQIAAQQSSNQALVAGQMRDRTSPEALDAAYDAAIAQGDLKAATAIKAMQADKFTKVGANETILDRNGRPVFSNTAGAEIEASKEASAERRADRRAEAVETAAQIRADQADRRLDAMMQGMNKAQKSAWQQQYETRLAIPGATPESVLRDMSEAKAKPEVQNALSLLATGTLQVPKGADPLDFAMQSLERANARKSGGQMPVDSGNRPPLGSFQR